ncbi:tRNA pseudouridine55 synthase [Salipaludibacillus aurantiacus]|uniref:tRNA pseudouridine synthase B n=1 Tax=Salipaludibacillus aurantiacus TaxID=1601833 RepID=A0A1H9QGZ1_9BACI|nr:tRNA pseudouridine55 synthase [Salipaludibacillus aurantiacus]
MKNEIMGVFPLWKPKGMTSFSAVKEVGKRFNTKKAGHTGTLDPDVEGVLPVCLGKATKIVEYLTADHKTYKGEVTLGFSTTTEDAGGEVVDKSHVDRTITENEINSVFKQLTGALEQTPPMYSAVKVKGKKLYEYAREGKTVDRPSRQVTIYDLDLLSAPRVNNNGTVSFQFRAKCSKGTYIRTLSVQIGEKLGYPSHMSHLVREASGPFVGEDCVTLDELDHASAEGRANDLLIPVERALERFSSITISGEIENKVLQGAILPVPEQTFSMDESIFAIYNQEGRVLALYKKDEKRNGMMKPEKMIRTIHD